MASIDIEECSNEQSPEQLLRLFKNMLFVSMVIPDVPNKETERKCSD